MDLNFAFSTPSLAPFQAASGHVFIPCRPKAATFQDWRHALAGHPTHSGVSTHRPVVVVSMMPAMPAPMVLPEMPGEVQGKASQNISWSLARAIFQSQPNAEMHQASERGTFSTEGEWNDLPSRIETFLHSSQTKQTVTGVAFLVMLLLWAI